MKNRILGVGLGIGLLSCDLVMGSNDKWDAHMKDIATKSTMEAYHLILDTQYKEEVDRGMAWEQYVSSHWLTAAKTGALKNLHHKMRAAGMPISDIAEFSAMAKNRVLTKVRSSIDHLKKKQQEIYNQITEQHKKLDNIQEEVGHSLHASVDPFYLAKTGLKYLGTVASCRNFLMNELGMQGDAVEGAIPETQQMLIDTLSAKIRGEGLYPGEQNLALVGLKEAYQVAYQTNSQGSTQQLSVVRAFPSSEGNGKVTVDNFLNAVQSLAVIFGTKRELTAEDKARYKNAIALLRNVCRRVQGEADPTPSLRLDDTYSQLILGSSREWRGLSALVEDVVTIVRPALLIFLPEIPEDENEDLPTATVEQRYNIMFLLNVLMNIGATSINIKEAEKKKQSFEIDIDSVDFDTNPPAEGDGDDDKRPDTQVPPTGSTEVDQNILDKLEQHLEQQGDGLLESLASEA